MKLKKGDKVVIIAGKNKGELGIIKSVHPTTNKVIVEDINIITKHKKPSQANPEGGIEKLEAALSASNVMINVGSGKQQVEVSRVKIEIKKNAKGKNERIRIAKKTGIKL